MLGRSLSPAILTPLSVLPGVHHIRNIWNSSTPTRVAPYPRPPTIYAPLRRTRTPRTFFISKPGFMSKMTVLGKSPHDSRVPLFRLLRVPCTMLMLGALVVSFSHTLLGSRPFYVLGRLGLQYPNMPVRRTCLEGITAVDSEGRPCISLKNLTRHTFIHYAKTPETTYMYCSIPKNGCSYHIDMLHRVVGDSFPGRTKHQVVNKGKIMLRNEQHAATLLSDSRVPKYMVIRNPMTRTLSGYLCKVETLLPEIEKTPASFQRWAQDQFTNLTSWDNVNSHWRAQTELCGYGMRDIQKRFHVFRVEEPEGYVDFLYKIIPPRILEKGWGENNTNFRDFVLRPHKRTSNTEAKFYAYVGNLKTFDLLELTFRKDIDTLGYREQVTEMRRVLVDITEKAAQRTMRMKV